MTIKNLFKINNSISLTLKDGNINILVKGEEFMTCKGIAINVPVMKLDDVQDLISIDRLMDKYFQLHEELGIDTREITPETEFMVHCSNLQAWAENGYDTNLLHYNLAFPLLKKLAEVGDFPSCIKILSSKIIV